jgi:hypothetical protein
MLIGASELAESIFFTFSHATRTRSKARGLVYTST